MMIDEVLFLEARVFREFCTLFKIRPSKANEIFKEYQIWNYIEDSYEGLHMSGDDYIVNDISEILKSKGAAI